MNGEAESVLHVTPNAAWLPASSRAEVILAKTPPRPMCVTRLLILRDRDAFCVPRHDRGVLDLPMNTTSLDDPAGTDAIRALADEVVGADAGIRFMGAVRNVVEVDDAQYDWPTPHAHFGVWTTDRDPVIDGVWVSIAEGSLLSDRHWFPLVR